MLNMIKNLMFFLTLSAIVSCTEVYRRHGYTPSEDQLANVVVGVDTRTSVKETLGWPITGDNSAAYAAKFPAGSGKQEYKASHILVETELKAREILAMLDEGADFSGLAIEHSTGPSGPRGGDLGWFSKGQMVAPFENAVKGMEEDTYTGPVKTQFGYHLIFLNNRREISPPTFEDVRSKLEVEKQHTTGGSFYYISSRWLHYGLAQPKPITRQIVAINFDKSDVVKNISRYELADGDVVVLSRRITAGGAKEISFIKQLMGSIGRIDAEQILQQP